MNNKRYSILWRDGAKIRKIVCENAHLNKLLRTTMIAAIVVCGFSLLCAGAPSGENIAPKSQVVSSPLPNPIWSERKAADDSLGPTDGWLGEWSPGVVENPWLKFVLPGRMLVNGMEIAQAAFKETGANRFMRPKNIHVEFIDGAIKKRLDFQLRDAEGQYQELKFPAVAAEFVLVSIDNVYGDARIANMTGFQEIRIYGTAATLEAAVKKNVPSRIEPTVAGDGSEFGGLLLDDGADSAIIDGGGDEPKGTLDADEKQILALLRELIARLEKKFLED